MDVFWMEQTEGDVPPGNEWLSAREMMFLNALRFAKRRTDWRLGRWTAKHALAACLNLPAGSGTLANIEILAALTGAPEVFLFDQRADVTISLSHRGGSAVCCVALSRTSLGCDLEVIEPRDPAFVADYFTVNEQALVERTPGEQQPLLVTLCWSAKESALKALQVGLRLDTNCMDVCPADDTLPPQVGEGRQDSSCISLLSVASAGWHPLHVRYADAQVFHGWWRQEDHMVRTVVSALPLGSPLFPT